MSRNLHLCADLARFFLKYPKRVFIPYLGLDSTFPKCTETLAHTPYSHKLHGRSICGIHARAFVGTGSLEMWNPLDGMANQVYEAVFSATFLSSCAPIPSSQQLSQSYLRISEDISSIDLSNKCLCAGAAL